MVASSALVEEVSSASNAGAAALQALKNMDYRYFVAGGTCAAISHGITTPIDVVKTKIQANPKVRVVCKFLVLFVRWCSFGRLNAFSHAHFLACFVLSVRLCVCVSLLCGCLFGLVC